MGKLLMSPYEAVSRNSKLGQESSASFCTLQTRNMARLCNSSAQDTGSAPLRPAFTVKSQDKLMGAGYWLFEGRESAA
jgi:hypothetical protein